MIKFLLAIATLSFASTNASGQKKGEQLEVEWPIEYNWKVVQNTNDESTRQVMIIPGNEKLQKATIIGSIKAYLRISAITVDSIILWYRSQLDSGSKLTVIDRNDTTRAPWVIFKVETPITPKYPIPESDLYYVRQGQFALFENYVAIRRPSFDEEFLNKWVKILKTAELVMK